VGIGNRTVLDVCHKQQMTLYPSFSSRKKPVWIVDYSVMGKQKRPQWPRNPDVPKEQDPGYIAAEKFKKSQTQKIFNEGSTLAEMDNHERVALLGLYAKIRDLKMTIAEVQDMVIQKALEASRPANKTPLVPQVIDMCLLSKNARLGVGVSARYLKQFKSVMGQFALAFQNLPIDQLSALQIEAWIHSNPEHSPSTRRSRLADVKTLTSFCLKRKIITYDPCSAIEAINVPRKTPGILSPRQAAKLMRVVYNRDRRLCAYFALQLFCGIRAEEMDRLTKDRVILEKNIVHIPEAISKTKSARNIEIPENAREWLKIDSDYASVRKNSKGVMKLMGIQNLKKRFDRVRRQAGLFKHWPNRAMRHSAATYTYALTDDANYTSRQMGHDVNVLLQHYRATKTPRQEIVTRELAQEYFAIRPVPVFRILENVA